MKVYLGADSWGKELKDSIKDHLIHLTNSSNDEVFKNLKIQDLGTNDKYYEIAGEVAKLIIEKTEEKEAGKEEKRGILISSTGMGMSIIANKYPGVYASPCESSKTAFNSRGINNSNVITLGSTLVTKEEAKEIVETWLKTKFTAGWEDNKETREFLIQSMIDIPELLTQPARIPYSNTPLYADSSKDEHFVPIPGMDERCKWCVLRSEGDQNHDNMERVRMILRLPKGSMEPKHHHSHGHDIFVIRGHQTVENLTTGVNYTLRPGQYLYTPAGQVHQVYYHEDTEFWFGSDEEFDMIWDGEEKGVIYKENH